jgi:hypothetical protein
MGLPSLATAALIGWEWLQRETDIFATFSVAHYRPKDRPDMVRVIHHKTREENYVPLFKDGVALYPELMAELDAIKRERIGGLMLSRDWGDSWPKVGTSRSRCFRDTSNARPIRSRPAHRSGVLLERKAIRVQNERQHRVQNGRSMMQEVLENIGAGEGNRTLVRDAANGQPGRPDPLDDDMPAAERPASARRNEVRR